VQERRVGPLVAGRVVHAQQQHERDDRHEVEDQQHDREDRRARPRRPVPVFLFLLFLLFLLGRRFRGRRFVLEDRFVLERRLVGFGLRGVLGVAIVVVVAVLVLTRHGYPVDVAKALHSRRPVRQGDGRW